ncbi:DL-endopeptidase inhibitor IseA family protein [Paenibacillus lentus]|uniref:DL-endopeptidase inhibitor IseA family protein n=1 Tax=Paenibacillus lentus TaxID=1338368 RepID=UPI003650B86E
MRSLFNLLYIIGLTSVLFLSGCNSSKPVTDAEESEPISLNDQMAIQLRDEAIAKLYTALAEGGEQCTASLEERLADAEEYYYYFCIDLDTKEKITAYLRTSYTESVVREMLDNYPIKNINDKLVYLPYEVGSLREWEEARVIGIMDFEEKSEITFEVPDVDGETEVITIDAVYEAIDDKWKLDTAPWEYI